MQRGKIFMGLSGIALLTGAAANLTAQGGQNGLAGKVQGRWDIEYTVGNNKYPAWLEIKRSGHSALVGRFVYAFGSARPVSKIEVKDDEIQFSIPPQWEWQKSPPDMNFTAKLDGDILRGTTTDEKGEIMKWEGRRAPLLRRKEKPQWDERVTIFDGKSLDNWKATGKSGTGGWELKDGTLSNEKPGDNIVTKQKFQDFKLHAEFRYPSGSNSGIYLRGRYEMQIEDNYGQEPDSHFIGGIYGFLTPSSNPAKPAGEWQSVDITLLGRHVTVVLNGETIIANQEIPGITGGAIDSREAEPGPLMIQGDHGKVQFRNIVITPARYLPPEKASDKRVSSD
jgi:hypothetical protein